MESLSFEEETIIKNIGNLFRLNKQNYTGIKYLNLFRLQKTKAIKDRILRDIKNLFEYEEGEENYSKPVRASSFWSNNHIECESNGDKNKTLSAEEYLNQSRPYIKDIINNLKISDT